MTRASSSDASDVPPLQVPVVAPALSACRSPLAMIGVFSGVINILMMAGSLYMLQVYDRVMTSRSVPTLVGLSLILVAVFVLQGFLDALRLRMLARVGARFDAAVSPAAFASALRGALRGGMTAQALQPVRDLDQIRSFLASLGPTALFDMPWMALFLVGCFLLHPSLGWLVVFGGAVTLILTLVSESYGRKASRTQTASAEVRQSLAGSALRSAEPVTAMGMEGAFLRRWCSANARYLEDWLGGSDRSGGINAFTKAFRMALQSAVLGLGAYLSIHGEVSGGAMIAASIMSSRALAPVELAVAHWKAFVGARDALKRLLQVIDGQAGKTIPRTSLPAPAASLDVEDLFIAAPGSRMPQVQGVSFSLAAGDGLAIIGQSASGKSSLARALVGVWAPLRGDVRLDGAPLAYWDQAVLGRHVGYLPQDVELADGTVAQNIARFTSETDDAAIIAAARKAGAHELILGLEQGYDTVIGEGGARLSGGQRQRIGLARALYGDPFLVVLDEPNSNLDLEGDAALTAAVLAVRERGGIVVLVTHRNTALAGLNRVAVMAEGRFRAFGPKQEILRAMHARTMRPDLDHQKVAS